MRTCEALRQPRGTAAQPATSPRWTVWPNGSQSPLLPPPPPDALCVRRRPGACDHQWQRRSRSPRGLRPTRGDYQPGTLPPPSPPPPPLPPRPCMTPPPTAVPISRPCTTWHPCFPSLRDLAGRAPPRYLPHRRSRRHRARRLQPCLLLEDFCRPAQQQPRADGQRAAARLLSYHAHACDGRAGGSFAGGSFAGRRRRQC